MKQEANKRQKKDSVAVYFRKPKRNADWDLETAYHIDVLGLERAQEKANEQIACSKELYGEIFEWKTERKLI